MTGRWLSKAAVLWVLYEAPGVPAHLLSTLIAVAAHTDQDGKGAYISAATAAEITRKTERNAKKDLAELTRLGLLLPGNQRIVAHIRADRRPNVYDLPMPRGVAHDTPPSPNGVSQATARGVAQSPNGVSQATPEEVLKTSGTARGRASADGARAGAPLNPATSRRTAVPSVRRAIHHAGEFAARNTAAERQEAYAGKSTCGKDECIEATSTAARRDELGDEPDNLYCACQEKAMSR